MGDVVVAPGAAGVSDAVVVRRHVAGGDMGNIMVARSPPPWATQRWHEGLPPWAMLLWREGLPPWAMPLATSWWRG